MHGVRKEHKTINIVLNAHFNAHVKVSFDLIHYISMNINIGTRKQHWVGTKVSMAKLRCN